MCRDVSISVAQQNLTGFVWHTSGSKTPTKCMFQIMHPSLSEVGPLPSSLPPIIVNRRHRVPFVCKYKLGVYPALTINHRLRDSVEYHEPWVTDRLIRKARKIRKKVGASDDLQEPIWQKPKGMHQKTFGRYANEDKAITDEISEYIKAKFQLCGERIPRGFLL
jgi:hypothetical protein